MLVMNRQEQNQEGRYALCRPSNHYSDFLMRMKAPGKAGVHFTVTLNMLKAVVTL